MFQMFVLYCLCWRCCAGVFDESVSVMEGDSVTLNSGVTHIQEAEEILLTYGAKNTLIAKITITNQTVSKFIVVNGRFRDRLKLDRQTGSLIITNITTEHAGDYKLDMAYLPVPVLIFNSSQCSSSSSSSVQYCSVLCSVVNVSAVSLSWYKGNSVLSSISVSDLSISLSLPLEVEYQDNNTYSCVINNTISNHTTHLDINTLCQPCQDPPVSLTVFIAAAEALLLVVAVAIFCICRKHRKTNEDEITFAVMLPHATFPEKNVQKWIQIIFINDNQHILATNYTDDMRFIFLLVFID
ncbi:uncharacterized protein isoform X3 [Danio rerio]|uniref:Uncharacterized protein isoform X3 n=1 Tax=Danio rerio TaxID=7955 RepID=A0A8M9PZK7_DANRE|nr:uncharacterized protein LOC100330694 isoform X3 [Danio rerio]|eukprot:XP_021326540.1 uncharacterized protein LOC100330694 isoform X3 [Danio rerio]